MTITGFQDPEDTERTECSECPDLPGSPVRERAEAVLRELVGRSDARLREDQWRAIEALDHQHAAACDDQRLDRPPLVLMQARVAAAHEPAQDCLGPLTHGRVEPIGVHGTLSVLRVLGACDRHRTTVAWTIKTALPR